MKSFDSMRWIVVAFVLACSANPGQADDEKAMLNNIAGRMKVALNQGELSGRDLTLTIRQGVVSVEGQIDRAEESQVLVKAITAEPGVEGIQLNLGLGKPPAPLPSTAPIPGYAPTSGNYPYAWPVYSGPVYPGPSYPAGGSEGWTPAKLEWDDGAWDLKFHTRSVRFPSGLTEATSSEETPAMSSAP